MKKIGLFLIAFSVLPLVSFADYTIIKNESVNHDYQAWITNGWVAFSHTATSTVQAADRLDMYACYNTSAPTGNAYLGIYTLSGSTFQHIGSSTVSMAGNLENCATYPAGSSSSTLTFIFDDQLQWVPGVTLYFVFYADPGGTNGNIRMLGSPDPNPYTWRAFYSATTSLPQTTYESIGSQYRNLTGVLRATGVPPITYNASTSPVACSTFDIGCYLSNGLVYIFYPSESAVQALRDLSLASTSPFGYVYDLTALWENWDSATNTPVSGITVDLTPFFGSVIAGSTTMEVLSASGTRAILGTTTWDLLQFLWTCSYIIAFMWYVWYRANSLV